MPSLNGYWIFDNNFTNQQWTNIQNYFGSGAAQLEYKFYLGNYGENEDNNWSVPYDYIVLSGESIYFSGGMGDEEVYRYNSSYPSSDYHNGWADEALRYGPNARFINITDDYGLGEDEDFYAFWTSIASEIKYPITNTKWLFTTTLSNPVDYATDDTYISLQVLFRSGDNMYGELYFWLWHNRIWGLYYDNTRAYYQEGGAGWSSATYKTISIYEFPSMPNYDEWTEVTKVLDVISLIGGNATYQGEADPKVYKLGWRVVAPVVTYNTIHLKRFWNNGTAKYKLNNGNEVTLSTSNQELTLSNVTKLEVSIDCDDIGSILIDTSSFKSFGESANLFDQDYLHSGWVDVTQYLQEGCYISLYPRD